MVDRVYKADLPGLRAQLQRLREEFSKVGQEPISNPIIRLRRHWLRRRPATADKPSYPSLAPLLTRSLCY